MPGQYLNAFAALDAREGIFCNQGSATFQKYFLFYFFLYKSILFKLN